MADTATQDASPQDDVNAAIRKKTSEIFSRLDKTDLDVQMVGKNPKTIERFPSGSYKLDHVLGGGWPKGRIHEVFGPASSGKTTAAIHALVEAQRQGMVVGFVDAEHALDLNYAKDIGLDTEALLLQQPSSGEQALQAMEKMVDEGVGLIVLDSVSSMVPQAEIDGETGDSHVGLQARLMSQACRKLTPKVQQHNATIIFINQIRMKIGVLFGNPETTSGGKALKFYSSVRLRLQASKHDKEGGTTVGNQIIARCVKNKTAPPFRSERLKIVYGKGINLAYELVDVAEELGAIEKAGSWYKMDGETICQGADALEEKIRTEPEFHDTIIERIEDAKSGIDPSTGEVIDDESS